MNRFSKNSLPFVLFGCGTLLSVLIIVTALIFANPPQCPSYTASHEDCIIGANIGLGLYVLSGVGVWIVTTLLSVILGVRALISGTKMSRGTLLIVSLALVCGVGMVVYAIVAYFMGHVSSFVRS